MEKTTDLLNTTASAFQGFYERWGNLRWDNWGHVRQIMMFGFEVFIRAPVARSGDGPQARRAALDIFIQLLLHRTEPGNQFTDADNDQANSLMLQILILAEVRDILRQIYLEAQNPTTAGDELRFHFNGRPFWELPDWQAWSKWAGGYLFNEED